MRLLLLILGITLAIPIAAISIYLSLSEPEYQRSVEVPKKTIWLQELPPKLTAPVKIGKLKTIAIMDTGFDVGILEKLGVRFCKGDLQKYQYNAVIGSTGYPGGDDYGHGTEMAYLAASKAQGTNYCIIGVKIFDVTGKGDDEAIMDRALRHLAKVPGLAVLSMSFSGPGFRFREEQGLKNLAEAGVVLFAAAGNSKANLDESCNVYPACYRIKGLNTVGALDDRFRGTRASYSNYGSKINIWYTGTALGSYGTSVSTALIAGAYAAYLGNVEE